MNGVIDGPNKLILAETPSTSALRDRYDKLMKRIEANSKKSTEGYVRGRIADLSKLYDDMVADSPNSFWDENLNQINQLLTRLIDLYAETHVKEVIGDQHVDEGLATFIDAFVDIIGVELDNWEVLSRIIAVLVKKATEQYPGHQELGFLRATAFRFISHLVSCEIADARTELATSYQDRDNNAGEFKRLLGTRISQYGFSGDDRTVASMVGIIERDFTGDNVPTSKEIYNANIYHLTKRVNRDLANEITRKPTLIVENLQRVIADLRSKFDDSVRHKKGLNGDSSPVTPTDIEDLLQNKSMYFDVLIKRCFPSLDLNLLAGEVPEVIFESFVGILADAGVKVNKAREIGNTSVRLIDLLNGKFESNVREEAILSQVEEAAPTESQSISTLAEDIWEWFGGGERMPKLRHIAESHPDVLIELMNWLDINSIADLEGSTVSALEEGEEVVVLTEGVLAVPTGMGKITGPESKVSQEVRISPDGRVVISLNKPGSVAGLTFLGDRVPVERVREVRGAFQLLGGELDLSTEPEMTGLAMTDEGVLVQSDILGISLKLTGSLDLQEGGQIISGTPKGHISMRFNGSQIPADLFSVQGLDREYNKLDCTQISSDQILINKRTADDGYPKLLINNEGVFKLAADGTKTTVWLPTNA